jgi:arylsulfatase A-like enzyme
MLAAAIMLMGAHAAFGQDAAGPKRPNVIILTVDTLRADHLGCYGYSRTDISPNIDALAKDSLLFTNAITVRPVTGPSLAAMLTSMYPYQTGVWGNFVQLHGSTSFPTSARALTSTTTS